MLTFFNKRLHNKKGFTLIELIVVIAIIGILAAIAIPRMGGFTGSANKAVAEANHRIVVSAAQMFYSENSAWPANTAALDPYFETDFATFNTASPGTHTIDVSSGMVVNTNYDGALLETSVLE